MDLIPTTLDGCFQVRPFFAEDERGKFVKTFHAERFAALGLPTDWREEYYSSSRKGVIRGMHFQTPPYDHEKLVYCLQGKVLDVVVDLRKKSPTFGQYFATELDATYGHGLMIPKGMAHGFLALTDDVLMAYKVTTVYAAQNDKGIRWDSLGFDWGVTDPIISARDRDHPAFADFVSPF
ncbi:dTDP-4-dehydrorhamnose 3,5-epimerase [Massilia rhizosphaerae]|uniref:dTDP-4-dehydrorhamnose 3,5-epimerase n=1 Tax=Massilia rhizosphaerae TaxID=2784389 RepID=UPI0018DCB850|nr:dTDP-4-dehydrorhamnose 3,5-epimerase [Massilia rhizosphaerae]